jgi:hypothetical protein
MLADADLVAAIGAVAIASMGLAVMHKAYSAAFLRARTIGRARADADPGPRRRAEKRRALKRPKTLADVALPQEGSCAGAGRPEHGPLVYYSLRFLPEETASLSEEMKELQPDLLRGGDALAVFSALADDGRDAGARRLAKRLRAAAVTDGSVDAFPLACCFPIRAASTASTASTASPPSPPSPPSTAPAQNFAEAMGSDDPPFVSAEPSGPAVASWNRARLKPSASQARGVLVVRLSGAGAAGFARDLAAEGQERGANVEGGLVWIPTAVFSVR